jgi:glycosyltransferase involved in cell wall biosynthesis
MPLLPSLSVFFPCFNEEDNLPSLLSEALTVLPTIAKKFEIIIVDDGSTDHTTSVIRKYSRDHKEVRIISHKRNLGYGAALQTGIRESKYDWVFWSDADGQFKLTTLTEFVLYTDKFDAVIGYRAHRADTLLRKINGELYTGLINVLFGLGVRDIDCAFKLVRRESLHRCTLTATGAFTSAEILICLHRQKAKIKQLPVPHFKRQFGTPTGGSPRVIFRGLKETFLFYLKTL